MSNTTVVDDQAPSISYSPRGNWRPNSACVACNINNPTALQRLNEVASGGTWTNAWWAEEVSSVAANLEFQGTTVAVYFIMFFRSMDPRSIGIGNLWFFVDDRLELKKPIHAPEFVFEHDISPRTPLFQMALGSNGTTNDRHSLRIVWSHNGARPRVAVALDSIEYTPSSLSSSSSTTTATFSSSSPTSASTSQRSNRTAKIVGPIVALSVAILLGLVAFFLLRRRRRQNPTRNTLRRCAGTGAYHYVPARPASPGHPSQVETVEGRRISFSLPAPYPQTHTRDQAPNRPAHSRNRTQEEGHIEPFTLHLASSSQQAPRASPQNHQRTQPSRPSPRSRNDATRGLIPIRDVVSPAETNWSSFYTSPATVQVRGGANQPWAMEANASDGGSRVVQSGTGAATYADSSEGDVDSRREPPVYHH